MPDLNFTKILVVLVVALLVLGPDKLPKVARQAAGFYNDLRRFRESFNEEVREAFGDLGTLSTLPSQGKKWARSATVNALKVTPPDTFTRPTSSEPFGAQPGSGGPPDRGAVGAEPGTAATSGETASPPRPAGDDEAELDPTFN